MRIMIYMPDIFPGHINTVGQVKKGEHDKGHRNKINADHPPGIKQDAGKNNGRYGARSTQGPVIIVILVFEIAGYIRNNESQEV